MDKGTKKMALFLKEGKYARVESTLEEKLKLYVVDQQNGPKPENEVDVWKRNDDTMALCFKYGQQYYLLNVVENELKLEQTHGNPDINSLTDSYWFCMHWAASHQYRIHSKPFPRLCLIIKEEEDKQFLFDLGDLNKTRSAIAVFITQEKISW